MKTEFKMTQSMIETLGYISDPQIKLIVERGFELAFRLGVNQGLENARQEVRACFAEANR